MCEIGKVRPRYLQCRNSVLIYPLVASSSSFDLGRRAVGAIPDKSWNPSRLSSTILPSYSEPENERQENGQGVQGICEWSLHDGGTIGEGNAYLVMFEKGICAVYIIFSFGATFSQPYSIQFHFAGILHHSKMGRRKHV